MFKLGENIATHAGQGRLPERDLQLIQYAPTTEKVLQAPLLIVPPWINKFYILDLTPEKSFIRWASSRATRCSSCPGSTPTSATPRRLRGLHARGHLSRPRRGRAGDRRREVNAIGYCVGGTLLAVTLAYMAANGDERVAVRDVLRRAGRFRLCRRPEGLRRRGAARGVESRWPSAAISKAADGEAFNMLRSNDLIWPYVVNNYLGQGADAVRSALLECRRHAHAGGQPSFYLRNCYLDNRLSKGKIVSPASGSISSRVKIPVYNLATQEDHIAPAKSVFRSSACFGGPVRFVLTGSGHIAGVVNPPAREKYQYWTGDEPKGALEDWLARAEEHPGSWWDDWQRWIEAQDATRVKKKRRPGGGKLKPIEDAPGSYVRVRA